jgi:tetratricopeptide (TPR) repeat protein
MRTARTATRIGLVALLALSCRTAAAGEQYLDFLHAMQARGYGDLSLVYIDRIDKEEKLPDEVRQVLDLERSNSLRAASREAYNAKEADQRLAEAQKFLDKFLQEHADHPQVGSAMLTAGNFLFDRAQQRLVAAQGVKDEAEKAKALADVRTMLEQARKPFTVAFDKCRDRFKSITLPDEPGHDDFKARKAYDRLAAAREDAEMGLVEARLSQAKIKYFTAMTWGDTLPKDPKADPKAPAPASPRKGLLENAGKEFDDIFQAYRGMEPGVLAHTWHARVLEEQGNVQGAMDLYEEVLVNTPEVREADPDQAALFTQVALFRFQLLRKKNAAAKKSPLLFIDEADDWMKVHKAWARIPAYSGIALEAGV